MLHGSTSTIAVSALLVHLLPHSPAQCPGALFMHPAVPQVLLAVLSLLRFPVMLVQSACPRSPMSRAPSADRGSPGLPHNPHVRHARCRSLGVRAPLLSVHCCPTVQHTRSLVPMPSASGPCLCPYAPSSAHVLLPRFPLMLRHVILVLKHGYLSNPLARLSTAQTLVSSCLAPVAPHLALLAYRPCPMRPMLDAHGLLCIHDIAVLLALLVQLHMLPRPPARCP
jgi:hypothetical protein